MEEGFNHLRCPMCGDELVYSEGTHDLCCRNNQIERTANLELQEVKAEQCEAAQKAEGDWAGKATLHEKGAHYFAGLGEANNVSADKENSSATTVGADCCVFAISFTESGRYGTLWSVRTVDQNTNYFALIRLMRDIEKRQRKGEPLAANIPNLPRKTERSAVSKLAFRYSIEVEDLYSFRYSSETADRLAAFYGLSVRDIRHIKSADIPEGD